MKIEDIQDSGPAHGLSLASLLEKIEILRNSLRWGNATDDPQVTRALHQCNLIRDEVMQLSHQASFVEAYARPKVPRRSGKQPDRATRRRALIERNFVFEGVFGENPLLLEALETGERAAPTRLPVLIYGESGTGKELMAKVIHANSDHADQAYVSVNCGAIPANLIESELFGHKRGAFTGATGERLGKFEAANHGTIFLDEIGELPLDGQVKLLRVLQSSELQRVGSDTVSHVDVRIVAATNRNLAEMCEQGRFREDLYYRLSVIDIRVPPLRERRDEIALLIDYFSAEAAEELQCQPVRLTPRLRTFLLNYAYPGNIRELRNILYRVSCLADGLADTEHLPAGLRSDKHRPAAIQAAGDSTVTLLERSLAEVKKEAADAAERRYLEQGLMADAGKVANFARRVGMNRSHLWTLIKKHGIDVQTFKKA